jgi:hypothetical protein
MLRTWFFSISRFACCWLLSCCSRSHRGSLPGWQAAEKPELGSKGQARRVMPVTYIA